LPFVVIVVKVVFFPVCPASVFRKRKMIGSGTVWFLAVFAIAGIIPVRRTALGGKCGPFKVFCDGGAAGVGEFSRDLADRGFRHAGRFAKPNVRQVFMDPVHNFPPEDLMITSSDSFRGEFLIVI